MRRVLRAPFWTCTAPIGQAQEQLASLDEAGAAKIPPCACPLGRGARFLPLLRQLHRCGGPRGRTFATRGAMPEPCTLREALAHRKITLRLSTGNTLRHLDPATQTCWKSRPKPHARPRPFRCCIRWPCSHRPICWMRLWTLRASNRKRRAPSPDRAGQLLRRRGADALSALSGGRAGTRHDLEALADHFGASIEQVAHRLSTLQRPGAKGVPFYFVRVDQAGTITKRHSATRLQFARFGGACPLWNVHRAFETPGRFLRQLAETPDGVRYFCLALAVSKGRRGVSCARAPLRHRLGMRDRPCGRAGLCRWDGSGARGGV
jgi:XRE family transcriptional regulator, fatty acid utilization regulator